MPQQPLSDAASDAGWTDPTGDPIEPLQEAAHLLAEEGAVSIAWLNAELRVISTAGRAVDGLSISGHATETFLPLIGLEADLNSLKKSPSLNPLRLSNTAIIGSDGRQSKRHDIAIYWSESRQSFLVHMSRVVQQSVPSAEIDQEIRRRRLFEQDLAAKTQEYARINEQLEQFAYVISHDLNAPLRALRYLSGEIQDLIEKARDGAELDTEALDRAAAGTTAQARRMSKMLTDLLDYARIGRVQEAVETVDTRSTIADIITTLRASTHLDLVISGDWPVIDTAAAPLDLVLRNLAENAVKHHDREHGRVEIVATSDTRHVTFSVIDDGRGIPSEWQSAIFEPFRKIDDAHHPESSGIGLALVKKTIIGVGGTIEVRSDPALRRGTTFIVRWPRHLAVRIGD